MWVVKNKHGNPVTPECFYGGEAITYAVKRRIPKLLPSGKEKRDKWEEMKMDGYQLTEIPNE